MDKGLCDMNHDEIVRRIEENPIIAAVRAEDMVEVAVHSPVSTIFLLHADIFNIKSIVTRIKQADKSVFIHIDFLEGLGRDNKALDYICGQIQPHGIISTKNSNIRYAMGKGMFTIQRVFLIDSMSYQNSVRTVQSIKPNMIEMLPGIMPNILKRISGQLDMPVIAGGLVETKEEIMELLGSGALAVSTGKKELWGL